MSSITGGNFNGMPFNAGANRVSQHPVPKEPAEMPRKAQSEDEKSDSFTLTSKPPEKSVFPVASTAIGGGVAGAVAFGFSGRLVPKNQPKELTAIGGKGVTIDKTQNIVEHNGFEYQMEKADGKWTHKIPFVDIGEIPYEFSEVREFGLLDKKKFLVFHGSFDGTTSLAEAGKPSSSKASLNILTDNMIEGLSLKDGDSLNCMVADGAVFLYDPKDANKPKLIFDIEKNSDGTKKLVISKELQAIIDDNTKYPEITSAKMEAIVDGDFAKNFKIFEAHDKLPSLKSPERIENLIQGMGRKWPWIIAITAGAIAAGAGIGYLLGNKKPQQPSPTKG